MTPRIREAGRRRPIVVPGTDLAAVEAAAVEWAEQVRPVLQDLATDNPVLLRLLG